MKRFVTMHPQQRNAFYIANEYDVAGPSFNLNLYKVTQAAFKEEKHGISVIQSFVFAECICNKTQGGESSRKKNISPFVKSARLNLPAILPAFTIRYGPWISWNLEGIDYTKPKIFFGVLRLQIMAVTFRQICDSLV